jgi:hypothetical protein
MKINVGSNFEGHTRQAILGDAELVTRGADKLSGLID